MVSRLEHSVMEGTGGAVGNVHRSRCAEIGVGCAGTVGSSEQVCRESHYLGSLATLHLQSASQRSPPCSRSAT